jgi:hypothetical protein
MLLFAVVFVGMKGNSTWFWSKKQLILRDFAERGQERGAVPSLSISQHLMLRQAC